jgi:hypothetical protein
VTRKNMGVTRNEVKNQVMILGVITHLENMIIIRLVDVFTKTVEVACHQRQHISESEMVMDHQLSYVVLGKLLLLLLTLQGMSFLQEMEGPQLAHMEDTVDIQI